MSASFDAYAFGRRIGLPLGKRSEQLPSLRRVAIHEAGHAASLLDQGEDFVVPVIRDLGKWLDRDGKPMKDGARTYSGEVRTFGSEAPRDRAHALSKVRSALAGPLAEARQFRVLSNGYEEDLVLVVQLAQEHSLSDQELCISRNQADEFVQVHAAFIKSIAQWLGIFRYISHETMKALWRTREDANAMAKIFRDDTERRNAMAAA